MKLIVLLLALHLSNKSTIHGLHIPSHTSQACCNAGSTIARRFKSPPFRPDGIRRAVLVCRSSSSSTSEPAADLQSDSARFGRGTWHLSAVLNERDVVAYQTGRWLVDGVVVGDTDTSISPTLRYCYIDTIQVVWTHNCEHGVLRGIELVPQSSIDAPTESKEHNGNVVIVLQSTGEMIEFGPEQLVARIPVDWMSAVVGSDDDDGSDDQCVTLAPVMHDEWLMCD